MKAESEFFELKSPALQVLEGRAFLSGNVIEPFHTNRRSLTSFGMTTIVEGFSF